MKERPQAARQMAQTCKLANRSKTWTNAIQENACNTSYGFDLQRPACHCGQNSFCVSLSSVSTSLCHDWRRQTTLLLWTTFHSLGLTSFQVLQSKRSQAAQFRNWLLWYSCQIWNQTLESLEHLSTLMPWCLFWTFWPECIMHSLTLPGNRAGLSPV